MFTEVPFSDLQSNRTHGRHWKTLILRHIRPRLISIPITTIVTLFFLNTFHFQVILKSKTIITTKTTMPQQGHHTNTHTRNKKIKEKCNIILTLQKWNSELSHCCYCIERCNWVQSDEFELLTAWRKKLLHRLLVQQWILLYLLPDGSSVNRPWPGWARQIRKIKER